MLLVQLVMLSLIVYERIFSGIIIGSVVRAAAVIGLCILFGAWWTRWRSRGDAQIIQAYGRVEGVKSAAGTAVPHRHPHDAAPTDCEESPGPPPYSPCGDLQ